MNEETASRIKSLARQIGFDECRIAKATEAPHGGEFLSWLEDGFHGEMAWLARNPRRRIDPGNVLPGCRSVVCLALNYHAPAPSDSCADPASAPYRIARYALGDDYHEIIEKMLAGLDEAMRGLGGTQRCYVDYGPVLEHDFATVSGLGWTGKSCVQIHPDLGTWFFLSEILTTLDLAPDPPTGDRCGRCSRCIDACPTRAILAPRRLDARRCISYLTIENKGPIPEPFRRAVGNRIYGCDTCMDVCPWNRFAKTSRESRFHAREEIFRRPLRDFLRLDDESFRALFARSPIKRIKLPGFLRNVCVALGNTGGREDLPALESASRHPSPLVAEHARWAMRRIGERGAD
jgi:epoxyqueuosine reductase